MVKCACAGCEKYIRKSKFSHLNKGYCAECVRNGHDMVIHPAGQKIMHNIKVTEEEHREWGEMIDKRLKELSQKHPEVYSVGDWKREDRERNERTRVERTTKTSDGSEEEVDTKGKGEEKRDR